MRHGVRRRCRLCVRFFGRRRFPSRRARCHPVRGATADAPSSQVQALALGIPEIPEYEPLLVTNQTLNMRSRQAQNAIHGAAAGILLFLCGTRGVPVVSPKQSTPVGQCQPANGIFVPTDYPDAFQAWEKVSQVLVHYKGTRTVCANQTAKVAAPQVSFHRVAMSDGASLWTIVIDPEPSAGKRATVLARSPYGPTSQNLADIFALTNGHVAVLQDDEGTWRSNGTFDLWRQDRQDAVETLQWITEQPWSNGEVYTVGASADGTRNALHDVSHARVVR